ncbi:hypothetical protein [Pelotomaculum sp. FP]|uniref:hypothetical protein n=1 Tax=Pelotomaculum sp. FP TaxID=261474 RepID=UPI001863A0AD|nr:hypothetical protein [Pelotomaculum sp. FP]
MSPYILLQMNGKIKQGVPCKANPKQRTHIAKFSFPAGAVIAHVKLPLKNNGAGELFLL